MAQAVRIAYKGLYTCDPNPRVGCVLVRDGVVVGEGWHEAAGQPHAEVNALRQAGDKAKGATAYVTLEPCSHTGRTPPCTNALIAAGVERVVAAMQDPNPKVSGSGFAQLQQAGIVVDSGVMEPEARAINPGFIKRFEHQKPYVRCKLAMSFDGRTAMSSGESKWITGSAARQDVQGLRARSSAIITGIGTVLADDPSLTVRAEQLGQKGLAADQIRQPLRVVLDTALRLSATAKLFQTDGPVLVMTASKDEERKQKLERAGAEVVVVPIYEDRLDLGFIMQLLAEREINEVLVEAGSKLSGAILNAGLMDELIVYVAPHIMGDGGKGLFHLPGLESMEQRVPINIVDVRKVGVDWKFVCKPGIATADQ